MSCDSTLFCVGSGFCSLALVSNVRNVRTRTFRQVSHHRKRRTGTISDIFLPLPPFLEFGLAIAFTVMPLACLASLRAPLAPICLASFIGAPQHRCFLMIFPYNPKGSVASVDISVLNHWSMTLYPRWTLNLNGNGG